MALTIFVAGNVLEAQQLNDSFAAVGGLRLLKKQTIGSAVSSVQVTGAFSADYDHYRIALSGGTMSTGAAITLTLGATVTGYSYWQFARQTGSFVSADAVNTTSMAFGYGTTALKNGVVEVFSPFAADETQFMNGGLMTTGAYYTFGGYLNNTTSYTDFTITASTGTLTGGTIYVYGYGTTL